MSCSSSPKTVANRDIGAKSNKSSTPVLATLTGEAVDSFWGSTNHPPSWTHNITIQHEKGGFAVLEGTTTTVLPQKHQGGLIAMFDPNMESSTCKNRSDAASQTKTAT